MNKEIALTPEGQAKLEDELRHLETVRRREVGERIKEAKEFGDISENSEYDDAKNEQAWVESRIIEVTQILARATIIDAPKKSDKVTLGSKVKLESTPAAMHTSTRSSVPPRPIPPTTRSPTSRRSARRSWAARRATPSRSPRLPARSSSTRSSRSPADRDDRRAAHAAGAQRRPRGRPLRRTPGEARRASRGRRRAVSRSASTSPRAPRELDERYADLEPGAETEDVVIVAGRVVATRDQGKIVFLVSATPPATCSSSRRVNVLGEDAFSAVKDLDLGDWVGATGTVLRTRRGELSVAPTEVTLLSKSLRPLPEKYHGLSDTETRYRQRYVDLIANPEVRDVFETRFRIISAMRRYMEAQGFLEVETPMLHPIPGGATASRS